jgi:hypothetical protein
MSRSLSRHMSCAVSRARNRAIAAIGDGGLVDRSLSPSASYVVSRIDCYRHRGATAPTPRQTMGMQYPATCRLNYRAMETRMDIALAPARVDIIASIACCGAEKSAPNGPTNAQVGAKPS